MVRMRDVVSRIALGVLAAAAGVGCNGSTSASGPAAVYADSGSSDGATLDDSAATKDASGDAPLDGTRDAAAPALDEDGVLMLHPTKPAGEMWRLGSADPNTVANFEIEDGTKVDKRTEGALSFWNVLSHPLAYAGGGTGWTSRLHIHASGTTTQLYNWKTQKGWLATAADLKNQEFNVYARAHGVLDAPRTAFTLKIRGGLHSSSNGDLASCTMMVFAGKATSGVARFGKELFHPNYDYVKLAPAVDTSLTDGVWVGLKLVSYQRASEPTQIHYQLFIDRAPFDAAGKPKNGWELYSEFLDVEGKSTGAYTKLADWGGMLTTFRTDGLHDIDFAILSVREIVAP